MYVRILISIEETIKVIIENTINITLTASIKLLDILFIDVDIFSEYFLFVLFIFG